MFLNSIQKTKSRFSISLGILQASNYDTEIMENYVHILLHSYNRLPLKLYIQNTLYSVK